MKKNKQALILHGTDGKPDSNWFMWLKAKFEDAGYDVWLPQLPDAHVPNRQTWNDFVFANGPELEDAVVVGHSAGAVEVLNLLMDERAARIKFGVMVSAWPGGYPELGTDGDWEEGQFDYLFPSEGFDFERIRSHADNLAFVHGSDDPYCPLAPTKELAVRLNATLTIIPGGKHLGDAFPELPPLWDAIQIRL